MYAVQKIKSFIHSSVCLTVSSLCSLLLRKYSTENTQLMDYIFDSTINRLVASSRILHLINYLVIHSLVRALIMVMVSIFDITINCLVEF